MRLHVNQELELLKEQEADELPGMIRSRLDDTYQSLGSMPIPSGDGVQRPKRKQRRMIGLAALAAASILLILGSGFISPVMANALNQIPFIGNLFDKAGDAGLKTASKQGLTEDVNASVTHDGVTFSISELMYDGTRISMILTRETSDGENEPLKEWWDETSEEQIRSLKRGEPGSDIIQIWANGKKLSVTRGMTSNILDNNSSILSIEPDINVTLSSTFDLPDVFDLEVIVRDAIIKQDFNLKFPVKKTTRNHVVLTSEEMKSYLNYNMKIPRIDITDATMRMEASLFGGSGEDVEDFSDSLMYEIWNEKGDQAVLLHGSSGADNSPVIAVAVFEPFPTLPKSLVVKPYTMAGNKRVYISELEFTIPVEK